MGNNAVLPPRGVARGHCTVYTETHSVYSVVMLNVLSVYTTVYTVYTYMPSGTVLYRYTSIYTVQQTKSSDTGTRTQVSCVKGKGDNHLHYIGTTTTLQDLSYIYLLKVLNRVDHGV